MDEGIIGFKISEYTGRVVIALRLGNRERAKKAAKMLLILYRLQSRADTNRLSDTLAEVSSAERAMKKAEQSGIAFPLGKQRIEELRQEHRAAKSQLVGVGCEMCLALDLWQSLGATPQDLCNLCNRDYRKVAKEVDALKDLNRPFSKLVYIYNLDYKDPRDRDWIDNDVDAPFTHAVKEYYLDLMLNTPEGQAASREAFAHCFPEAWEKRLYTYTDTDGITHAVDKDGIEVGTIEEEDHGT